MDPRKKLGNLGEEKVARYLEQQGYTILARNFTSKSGELDLIAHKDDVIAFVEVKTRQHHYFATSQVVIPSKQRKIIKTAKYYIMVNQLSEKTFRFDIAIVSPMDIEYIPNAFYGA